MFAVAAVSSMRAQRFNLPSSAGATVSVATLRIPEKAWKHFDKAKAAAARNRPEESDREIAQAIQIAPGFAEAYLLRADLQIKAHSFAQAIDSVAEARRTVPDIPLAGILLAGAYNGLRRYTDANLVLENLHGSEAQSWQANYERARAATGLQDIEAALRWSAKALEFAPQRFADVCLVRANALLLARRWSDAAIQLQAYLKSDGPLLHRDEASTALVSVRERAREEDLVNLASR
jgi:tetratricopeptide (TPR) repeat protein